MNLVRLHCKLLVKNIIPCLKTGEVSLHVGHFWSFSILSLHVVHLTYAVHIQLSGCWFVWLVGYILHTYTVIISLYLFTYSGICVVIGYILHTYTVFISISVHIQLSGCWFVWLVGYILHTYTVIISLYLFTYSWVVVDLCDWLDISYIHTL